MSKNFDFKINITTIIILVVIFLLTTLCFKYFNSRITSLSNELASEVKLKNALIDTIKTYQNQKKEWVSERLTLQTSISNLTEMYGKLSVNQKELVDRIKELNKTNNIITAALIETSVKIDSLMRKSDVNVDTINNIVTFSDSTKNLVYNINVTQIKPAFNGAVPVLKFNKFILPNKQFVEFHWNDNKKEGYPISFSVSNSNDLFKTVNVDSYAIPNLQKDIVNPTKWQKFTGWMKQTGNFIITIGVAGGIGLGAGILLF